LAPEPTPSSLARSAASAGVATMTSRLLGLAREVVLAHQFGASAAMDAGRISPGIRERL
jgi:peptidoglycan biosynthesis protein MviN/MurJ (putative lipid II flippase)